jgi:hypothetical protein
VAVATPFDPETLETDTGQHRRNAFK